MAPFLTTKSAQPTPETPSPSSCSAPLERVDLSLYMPYGMWKKFEDMFAGSAQMPQDAVVDLISAYLFGEDMQRLLEGKAPLG